jgi:hypothetical protein
MGHTVGAPGLVNLSGGHLEDSRKFCACQRERGFSGSFSSSASPRGGKAGNIEPSHSPVESMTKQNTFSQGRLTILPSFSFCSMLCAHLARPACLSRLLSPPKAEG